MTNNSNKKIITSLNSLDQRLATIVDYICTFMLVAIMAIIFMAVICRFVIHYSTPWSEEFTRFTFIAMSFLGMGACLTKNEHIEIDIFAAIAIKIKDLNKRYLAYKLDDLFRFVFIGILAVYLFTKYFDYTIKLKIMNQVSAGLHLPMWTLYTVLTIAFALLIIHCVLKIILIIGDYECVRPKSSIEGGEEDA